MKKNIQINLFGTLYNIDDDAYNLLEQYIDSMRRYFSNQDGGEEIADDIEHRVAELLWQKKQQGMEAVDIDSVKEIISQIGNPQDIDGDAADAGSAVTDAEYVEAVETPVNEEKTTEKGPRRRLYRNPQDKVLGGVCSGLAEYVGRFDVVVWRLAFVVLTLILAPVTDFFDLFGGICFVPLIYVILCLIVPEAQTPEDRLRMKGDEVTPENINKEIINNTTQSTAATTRGSNGAGCLKVLVFIFLAFCLLPVIGLVGFVLFMILFAVLAVFGTYGYDNIMLHFVNEDLSLSSEYISNYGWLLISGLAAALLLVIIPCYLVVKRIIGGRFRKQSLVVMLIVWVLSAVWTALAAVICGTTLHRHISSDLTAPNDSITNVQPDTIGSSGELVDSIAIDVRSNDNDNDDETI